MVWNDVAPAWVADEAAMEALHRPICDALMAAATLRPAERVIDVGFGTGMTLEAAASAVGPEGSVVGLDIAEAMVARATQRFADTRQVQVRLGDAAHFDFEEGAADAIISLFGLMFFDDPEAAFASIARALRPGGRMLFAVWGARSANPWFGVPGAAMAARFRDLPPPDPTAPGPMSLADPDRVARILDAAGLQLQDVHDRTRPLEPLGTPREAARHMMRVSPLTAHIAALGEGHPDCEAILKAMEDGYAAFETPEGLRVPSHQRIYRARRPD